MSLEVKRLSTLGTVSLAPHSEAPMPNQLAGAGQTPP